VRLRSVPAGLRGATAPNEGKWGADEYGQNFAGGQGYVSSAENFEGMMGSKPLLLESYSTALRDAADSQSAAGGSDGLDAVRRASDRAGAAGAGAAHRDIIHRSEDMAARRAGGRTFAGLPAPVR